MKPEAASPAKPREAAPAGAPEKSSRFKKVAIVGGVALATLATAYGVGRLQGAANTRAADERAQGEVDKREQTEGALASEKARVQRLEARRRLHLALLALDDRNFGIAQEHVTAAGKLLTASAPEKDSELSKLASEITSEKLVATEDLGVQRGRLVGWARRMDAAMPPLKP